MRKFWLGFVIAAAIIFVGGFFYVRLGFVDPRADIPINSLEAGVAMPSLDAAVGRRAPAIKSPMEANDANLIAGMKVYQANCAVCHGDINHPHGMLADSLYPRAPQFIEDAPDMPESQNFYIIQHGIRLSGMPAWKPILRDQQIRQVTTFLSHMDKLPPQVSDAWKAAAGGAATGTSLSHPSSSTMDKKMHMQ